MSFLRQADPEIYQAIQNEARRQEDGLELIASENYTSRAVMEAQGGCMTNKYAEGYPGKRYYGGCEFVDVAEAVARERAKALFGAEHANVQPHSGSQANMAVYFTVLQPGDTILSMSLSQGGHLTHGHALNFSGKMYNIVSYELDPTTERIDYNHVREQALKHRPKLIICGGSAYSREIDFAAFRRVADEAGCLLMADIAHIAGLVAGKEHPDPVPYCDFVTTTTHKTLRGPRGGLILCKEQHAQAIDKTIIPGMQGGPLMHVIAAKAVALLEASQPGFSDYARQVKANASALSEALTERGYRIITGGTDNHLLLADLSSKNITGRDAEVALEKAGIITNRNLIPFDKKSPLVTSGLRLGSPALTTRGFKEPQMRQVAELLDRGILHAKDDAYLAKLHEEVTALCSGFPVYPGELTKV